MQEFTQYDDFLKAAFKSQGDPELMFNVEVIATSQGGSGYSGEKVYTISNGTEVVAKYISGGLNLDNKKDVDDVETDARETLRRDLSKLEEACKEADEVPVEDDIQQPTRGPLPYSPEQCTEDLIAQGQNSFRIEDPAEAYKALTGEELPK